MSVKELNAAWEWVLRLRDDAVTQDDLSEWLRWYEEDDRNKEAFEEMQAFWRGADRVLEGPGALTMTQLLGTSSSRRTPGSNFGRFLFNWTPASAGVTAVVVAAIALGVWWTGSRPMTEQPTAPNVVQQVLPDGSRVELAAKSSVVVRYTGRERALQLNGGEAYFAVARDRERPFVVTVGGLRVQAIGTAFNIRKAGERVVVAVTEGIVEVVSSSAAQDRVRIAAGHKATWGAADSKAAISPANASRTLAW